jgi:BirA family transcriptional regulator, biotin operon repressor / biotin---[acetyl-CoA-carboxylase] ligase
VTFDQGWNVHRYESLASTMDQATVLARSAAPDRTMVVTTEQTAGRGRNGRAWHSPRGSGLYCTLLLRPPVTADRLSTLPLVTGVAVAEAIERVTGHDARLKWPNDVWLGHGPASGKAGGILTTSRLCGNVVDHVLVGIGINLSTKLEDLPAGGTSIRMATGCDVSPDELLQAVLDRLDRGYDAYLRANGRPSLHAFRDRAALLGEFVVIELRDRRLSGRYAGIADDGSLILERDGTMQRIAAGNLRRGPRLVNTPGEPGIQAPR